MYHDQDISGAGGNFDIIGEAAKAVQVVAPALQRAVAAGHVSPTAAKALGVVLEQGSTRVVRPGLDGRELRRQVAPLPITVIAPASEALITLTPQRPFRVERLVLVSSAGNASLSVLNVFNVGATPQFVSDGSAPVVAFSPTAIATSFRGDTATPGITLTLRIQNTDPANPETIYGMIMGEALD